MPIVTTAIVASMLASAAIKGLSTFMSPKRADFVQSFEDNPDLVEALNMAKSRAKNPQSYERMVEMVSRRMAPGLQQQYEALKSLKDKPALFNKALQRINQTSALSVRDSLDQALLMEEREAAQGLAQFTELANIKAGMNQNKKVAEFEDKSRITDFFSDLGDTGLNVGSYMIGQKVGSKVDASTTLDDITDAEMQVDPAVMDSVVNPNNSGLLPLQPKTGAINTNRGAGRVFTGESRSALDSDMTLEELLEAQRKLNTRR